jgi:hypothetical protein
MRKAARLAYDIPRDSGEMGVILRGERFVAANAFSTIESRDAHPVV